MERATNLQMQPKPKRRTKAKLGEEHVVDAEQAYREELARSDLEFMCDQLHKSGIEYNEVKSLSEGLTESEIIERIAGGI